MFRNAPQYVNAKTLVQANGDPVDLNQDSRHETLRDRIEAEGSYSAVNYVDFTGDGWVHADCPQLEKIATFRHGTHAAYSLVTAPDFFPRATR